MGKSQCQRTSRVQRSLLTLILLFSRSMRPAIARWGITISALLILMLCVAAKAQEDSLRSALNAVDRRQRDLSGYHRHLSVYPGTGLSRYAFPDDHSHLAFLALENERKIGEFV